MRCALVAALVAGLLASGGGVAAAQDGQGVTASEQGAAPSEDEGAQARARGHFQAGASYYEAGSYEDALREFQRAYDLSQRPQLFYNLSLCYQNLDDYENAIAFLRRYLDEVVEIPNRANLELRIQTFQARLDARAQESTESSTESPAPSETGPGASPQGGGPNIGAIVGFSTAAVGLVMAGIFGGLTLAEDGTLAGSCSPNCSADQVGTLQTYALLTDIGFGVSLAGAAVGLILLLVSDSGSQESASLAPWLDGESGGLVLTGSF